MNVTVVGMGKIGLPLAVNFAKHDQRVTGLDTSGVVVSQINHGIEPFPGEKNLSELLKQVVIEKKLTATSNFVQALSDAEVVVVCIPLIVDNGGNPDFTNIDNLASTIGKNIGLGTLICFETTLPVGTTRNRFTKTIAEESKMVVGKDFFVVFSPERVLTGRIFSDLKKYPKLVGGVTEECTRRGVEFYRKVIDFDQRDDLAKPNGVWPMKNSEAAEFAKIAETTFRDVNIGLANEFAIYAKQNDIDILEVIEASNSQPYSMIHTPGIAVGGHCIPVYPRFYIWNNLNSRIVLAAREQNLEMPRRAIEQIKKEIGSITGMKIGLLGITYRPGVKESAFSGALDLLSLLTTEGAEVSGLDPFYNNTELEELGFSGQVNLNDVDGIIIHTAHPEFASLKFDDMASLKFVYDGRKSNQNLKNSNQFKYLSF
ncbi:WecC UDP-N-acetyl-D-mannosaminuronate dehydrogenase [actinobacterium SCGC AAA044-D11]